MNNLTRDDKFINKITDSTDKQRASITGSCFEILNKHGEIDIKVKVGRLLGVGASCLVYEVEVDDLHPPVKNMIMKEFFPSFRDKDIRGIRDIENPHHIKFESSNPDAEEIIANDRQKFIESYDKHIKIMEIDPLLRDMIVRPYRLEQSDDYLFALYDIDNAQSVDKYKNLDFARVVSILRQSGEILSFLHRKDIIYMDLKPANILYDYKADKVKLFDFDAAVFLDELELIDEFFMPNQRAFIPPELRFISNLNKRKDIFITEEIDLYMLGVSFFYLLMDRLPEDLENENMDYLERNLRACLNKISNQIFLKPDTTNKVVDLFKETLTSHRYISIDEFVDRLREIENGLDTLKNQSISSILSAAYTIDNNPLFDYINEDENGAYVDVAIAGDLDRAMEYFNIIFASVDLDDVELRFNIYTRNSKESYKKMTSSMPLLKETCKISIDGKVRDDKLNTKITDKYYAIIDFKKWSEEIDGHYVIILHEDGKNNYGLAAKLFEKYKDINERRFIINYTRTKNQLESMENDYVRAYNIDLESASSFRNKDYNEHLLNQAFNVHSFFTKIYGGERKDIYQIWIDFIKGDLYNIKSSIRAAISMKYKLYRAGSLEASDPAEHFFHTVIKADPKDSDLSMLDILADSEHHSWNRFMITRGYRVPSKEEFVDYAYAGFNSHIDRENKLHPLIANSDIKKFKSGEDDYFEHVSDQIHQFLRDKTSTMGQRVLDRIDQTLINTNWHYNDNLRDILPLWEELLTLTRRIIDREAYASNTWHLLKGSLDEKLAEDFIGKEEILADYLLISRDIELIIEGNNKKDFRISDYMIIEAIPLINSRPVKTIFKPFISDEGLIWANVIAAIKYSPRNLILISNDKEIQKDKFLRIVDFMKTLRLQKSMNIELISYDEIELYSKEDAIVDLTLNSHTDAKKKEIRDLDYVEYLGSNEWSGDFAEVDYYTIPKTLTVEETFFLNNAYYYNAKSEKNLARLNNYYEKIWQAYMSLPSYEWSSFNKIFKSSRNKYILNLSYPVCENTSMLEVGDFIFRRDAKLKYPKLITLLNEMKAEGLVIDYQFPINPGKLRIHTINDYLSIELGEFISGSLKNHYANFDFRKLYFPLMDEEDNKNIYYYAMSNNLCFSYEYKYDDPARIGYDLKAFMEDMDKDLDINKDIRVFNHIGNEEYVKTTDDRLILNYELGDIAFREFLEKGMALKVYTYFELIRKSQSFDEIKVDVGLKWKAYGDYSPFSQGVENTLNIVCTKGFSTFIITCIQEDVSKDLIYQINNHASRFGIDTKPILISSYSEGLDPSIKKIAQASDVYLIDRKMLEENRLIEYLENIANVVDDWENIDN